VQTTVSGDVCVGGGGVEVSGISNVDGRGGVGAGAGRFALRS